MARLVWSGLVRMASILAALLKVICPKVMQWVGYSVHSSTLEVVCTSSWVRVTRVLDNWGHEVESLWAFAILACHSCACQTCMWEVYLDLPLS